MEKDSWREFLAAKVRTQIALETSERAQTWALALAGFLSLGFALSSLREASAGFLFGSKFLFVIFFHLWVVFAFCIPSLLQKGENPVSALLGIRDWTTLVWSFLTLAFYAGVIWNVGFQVTQSAGEMQVSAFPGLLAGINLLAVSIYFFASLFSLASLFFFPKALGRILEKSGKFSKGLLVFHSVFAFLLCLSYGEIAKIGSPAFFEQFRFIGLFWVYIFSSLLLIGHLLKESSLPLLSALELEVISGKLERKEDILSRFKEAYLSRRLAVWIHQLSRAVATHAHEIAGFTHEAVSLVTGGKPSETDLTKVEDRYRKAEARFKKLDRDHQRFLVCVSFFHLSEAERERIEVLRDQFSRELRNAKLELASVRKQIDDKLVSLKNSVQPPAPSEIPVEKIPVSR